MQNQNRNIEQQIKISETKLQKKKQQFIDIQNMDFNLVRQFVQPSYTNIQPFQNTFDNIQKYQEVRLNSQPIITQIIEPSKYKFSILTPEECRKYHEKLRERKGLHAQQMAHSDPNEIDKKYWKTYKEFVQRTNENNSNVSEISSGIAEIKNYIQILSKPINFESVELCSKQPIEEDTIRDLNVKYAALEKRIKNKEDNDDSNIEILLERARKYFGDPEPDQSHDLTYSKNSQ